MSETYINPALPSMIRGLYRADLRERSIQNVLDLAADLVQELIDLRAAVPAETEWEYTDSESNPGEHHLTRFSGSRDALNRRNEGRKRGGHPALPIWKRRKAGPWEPVLGEEGENDD